MKTKIFYLQLLIYVLLISLPLTFLPSNSFAQNYTQMSLPDGAKARLGKGHVKKILYSPSGNVLAVVSAIGIWIYDTDTYQELFLIPARVDSYKSITYESIAYSADGQTIIGETDYNNVHLWDATTGKLTQTYYKEDVSFSSDRGTLTIGSNKKTIKLWYGTSGNLNTPLREKNEDISSMAFSPDGQAFATADEYHNIRIWNTHTRKLKNRIQGHANFAYGDSISLSPNGLTLASLKWGKPIQLWDVETGKLKKILEGYIVTGRPIRKYRSNSFTNEIDSVVFNPDEQILATGSIEGTIRLWNVSTGKLINKFTGHIGFIKCLSFSPDGKILASGGEDQTIRLWDVDTRKHKQTLPLPEQINSISCISFSRDGNTLACGDTDGRIHLWDMTTGKYKMSMLGHTDEISNLMFNSDGSTIVTTSWDDSVRLWNVDTGKQKQTLTSRKNGFYFWSVLFFIPDGVPIAFRNQFNKMHLWDVINGQRIRSIIGHTSMIKSYPQSADGKTLATYSSDGTVILWDLTSITNTTD